MEKTTEPQPAKRPSRSIFTQIRSYFRQRNRGEPKANSCAVIINPAAGQEQPILKTLNDLFSEANWDWHVYVTKEAGDGQRYAREAIQQGASMVAALGGDGTVTEVASGMIGSETPLAILPGGTSNMMSRAFNIPQDIKQAGLLITASEHAFQNVYMGRVDDRYFLQLVGIGLEAKIVEGADRGAKDRFGILAYGLAALRALTSPKTAQYRLRLDDAETEIHEEGVSCLIANVGNLGITALANASPPDSRDETLLDIVIVRNTDLPTLVSLASTVTTGNQNPSALPHWQARKVAITTDPEEIVQADGEMLQNTPISVQILPQPVKLLVPKPVAEKTSR